MSPTADWQHRMMAADTQGKRQEAKEAMDGDICRDSAKALTNGREWNTTCNLPGRSSVRTVLRLRLFAVHASLLGFKIFDNTVEPSSVRLLTWVLVVYLWRAQNNKALSTQRARA